MDSKNTYLEDIREPLSVKIFTDTKNNLIISPDYQVDKFIQNQWMKSGSRSTNFMKCIVPASRKHYKFKEMCKSEPPCIKEGEYYETVNIRFNEDVDPYHVSTEAYYYIYQPSYLFISES